MEPCEGPAMIMALMGLWWGLVFMGIAIGFLGDNLSGWNVLLIFVDSFLLWGEFCCRTKFWSKFNKWMDDSGW
jgi:hypothetical protein